jgi:hypothetical protein
MPDLFETEIGTVHVACSSCGAPLELATSAIGIFGSGDTVLCMDCLLREGTDSSVDSTVPLADRIRLIDETVNDFSAHLRNVLVRCVKPDLTWNREYGIDEWSDPADVVAAAYAPGVWYSLRQQLVAQSSGTGDN